MWIPLIIQHAPLTAKSHCSWSRTREDITSHWEPAEMIRLLRQRLFTSVSVHELWIPQPWWRKWTYLNSVWYNAHGVNIFHVVCAPSPLYLCPAPVSLSSFHVYSTTTTALLTWKPHKQQQLSTLSLYDTHTQSVTHILNINSSEENSKYAVRGLHPGTRFKAKVVVITFLKHLNMMIKQGLSFGMETGIVHIRIT